MSDELQQAMNNFMLALDQEFKKKDALINDLQSQVGDLNNRLYKAAQILMGESI